MIHSHMLRFITRKSPNTDFVGAKIAVQWSWFDYPTTLGQALEEGEGMPKTRNALLF